MTLDRDTLWKAYDAEIEQIEWDYTQGLYDLNERMAAHVRTHYKRRDAAWAALQEGIEKLEKTDD